MARILIIDDELQIREMLTQMIEREGHEVLSADNGKTGIRLNRDFMADVVITDIFMPEKEGIETIMELRAGNPAVKIIAISGGGSKGQVDYLKIAKSLGATRALSKPVKRKDLMTTIDELLR
jgi:YesN/AraC family two-component response regulator